MIATFLNAVANPIRIIVEQPSETFWGVLLKAIPSLLGVAAGSLLTWLFTSHAENKRNLNAFILNKQKDVYFPLIYKIEKLIKKYRGTDYVAEYYGLQKQYRSSSIRKPEWVEFIDYVKSETRPENQGNYTKKIWNDINKIRQEIYDFENYYGKNSLVLQDMLKPIILKYFQMYVKDKGEGNYFNLSNTDFQYNPTHFEDMVIGVKKDSLPVCCIDTITWENGDTTRFYAYSRLEFAIKEATHKKLTAEEEKAIELFRYLNEGLKKDIPSRAVKYSIERKKTDGTKFVQKNLKLLDESHKRYERLVKEIDKCAESIRKAIVIF